jgi:hypothetical protein
MCSAMCLEAKAPLHSFSAVSVRSQNALHFPRLAGLVGRRDGSAPELSTNGPFRNTPTKHSSTMPCVTSCRVQGNKAITVEGFVHTKHQVGNRPPVCSSPSTDGLQTSVIDNLQSTILSVQSSLASFPPGSGLMGTCNRSCFRAGRRTWKPTRCSPTPSHRMSTVCRALSRTAVLPFPGGTWRWDVGGGHLPGHLRYGPVSPSQGWPFRFHGAMPWPIPDSQVIYT